MAAMQWRKKRVSPKRAMVTSDHRAQPIPAPSYFISIGIPNQPSTRIRIPELLVKTMHIRSIRRRRTTLQKCNEAEEFGNDPNYSKNKKKMKYWVKPRKFFPRKIRLMFSSVRKLYGGWNRVLKEDEEEEAGELKEARPESASSLSRVLKEEEEEEGPEELKEARPESASSLSRSLKELLEMEDEEGKKKSSSPLIVVGRQYLRVPLYFSRILNMKTGVVYIRGKIYKCSRRASSLFGKKENLGKKGKWAFVRRPIRSCRKLRMALAGPLRKKVSKQAEEEEEEEEEEKEELCSKRVLLGKRCKPLLL